MSIVCQVCNQAKATVHITDTLPKPHDRHLCEECAEREGLIKKQHHVTTNEILQQFIKQKTGLAGGGQDLSCPKCGLTFREFQVKGQLGCPHDYEVFRAVLTPLLERAHDGASHHVGKVPGTADETVQRETGLLRLRRELQEAIDAENYEQAAQVRDLIDNLENQ